MTVPYSRRAEKIIRQVGQRLVLTLGLIYCIYLINPTNAGLVMVADMATDLTMVWKTGPLFGC
jgi:hypothetical protein